VRWEWEVVVVIKGGKVKREEGRIHALLASAARLYRWILSAASSIA
jgi:hypothetical protein